MTNGPCLSFYGDEANVTASPDLNLCEGLAVRAAEGDVAAARELVERLWPHWLQAVRSSRTMAMLPRSKDHVHEVVARLAEKFGRPGGRGLSLYGPWRARQVDKQFADWMRIVIKNLIRDYVREQLGATRVPSSSITVKRLLNEFAASPVLDELGLRPPITPTQTARELYEFAERSLPVQQLEALGRWLQGGSFADLGAELGMSAEEAKKVLRAAIATLRRRFAPSP